MTPNPTLTKGAPRDDVLRLRTLILIRWAAITGQIVTLFAADQIYQVGLPLGLCFMVVGASVIVNLELSFTLYRIRCTCNISIAIWHTEMVAE